MDSVLAFPPSTAIAPPAPAAAGAPPRREALLIDGPNAIWRWLAAPTFPTADFVRLSPLFVHGPAGSGKSLLANVLAEAYAETLDPSGERVARLTLADFDRRLRHAAVVGNPSDVLAAWIRRPLLIFDDVHEPALSDWVAQALGDLLQQRRDQSRPTVLLSRFPPHRCRGISPRNASRIAAGLVAELRYPGRAGLRRWIDAALATGRLNIAPQAIEAWLEGTAYGIPHLAAVWHALIHRLPLGADVGPEAIASVLHPGDDRIEALARKTMTLVARRFGMATPQLTSPSRRRSIVVARGVAMTLLRDRLRMTWQRIAYLVGRIDHSTVIHAYRKTHKDLATDPALASAHDELQQHLATLYFQFALSPPKRRPPSRRSKPPSKTARATARSCG